MSQNQPASETPRCIVLCSPLGSHVPSFKNKKMLAHGKLITDPKKQKWMEECTRSFMSQLLFLYPITENETATVERLRSWIASSTPETDSCRYLTACSWRFTKTVAGLEHASIEITRVK